MTETYRNHPVALLKNIFVVLIIMFVITIGMSGSLELIAVMCVITVILCLLMVVFWLKTTITFGPNEAIVEFDFIYKKRKTIPYKKVAAVNVVRDVFDRIFGTTRLNININSSSNAATPEASFVFKADLAEQLKEELTSKLFQEQEEEKHSDYESLISLSMKDSVLHGFIGVSTYQFMFAIAMIAYSVFSAVFLEGSGIVGALVLLFVGEIIPVFFVILKYGNFKVYRVNDQIHLQHGIIQNYTSKFDVNRINAIRIKRTFFARLIGKSSLEAEVVGINAVSDDTHPLLCILAENEKIDALIKQLVPEFINEPPMVKQPKKAMRPLLVRATVGALATLIIMAYPCYWMYTYGQTEITGLSAIGITAITYALLIGAVVVMGLFYYGAHISYRIKEFGLGKDMFNLVNGLLDREILIMQYDRVQIVDVSASIFVSKLGLARCTIKLLSSEGYRSIKSGFFEKTELDKIGETMMQRLRTGEYRYDKNSI